MLNHGSFAKRRVFFVFSLCVALAIFFYLSAAIIAPFVISFFLAYLLNPLASRLCCRYLSRGPVSFLLVVALLLGLVVVAFLITPMIIHQSINVLLGLQDLVINAYGKFLLLVGNLDQKYNLNIFTYTDSVEHSVQTKDILAKVPISVFNYLLGVLKNLLMSSFSIVGLLSFLLVMPLVTFYILKDWPALSIKFRDLLPASIRPRVDALIAEIDAVLIGYVTAQFMVAVTLAIVYGSALSIIRLKHGLVIGIFTGLASFLPYVGLTLGVTISILTSIKQFDSLTHVLLVCIVFFVGVLIDTQILSPRMVAKRVGLHPVVVIFSLLFGGALMGLRGILISVPCFAVLSVFAKRIITRYKKSDLYLK